MIAENLSTLKIHKLTQAQYDKKLANGNIDKSALYLTPEEILSIEDGGTGASHNNMPSYLAVYMWKRVE